MTQSFLTWFFIAATFLFVACGRQDDSQNRLRQQQEQLKKQQEVLSEIQKKRAEAQAKVQKEQKERVEKAQFERKKESAKHGPLLLAGPMIEDQYKGTLKKSYRSFFEFQHNHGTVAEKEVKEDEKQNRRREYLSSMEVQAISQLTTKAHSSNSVIAVGCGQSVESVESVNTESNIDCEDEECIGPETSKEPLLLRQINEGLKKENPSESNLVLAEDIQSSSANEVRSANGLPEVQYVGHTVIICSLTEASLKNVRIVAERLILSNMNHQLVTDGKFSNQLVVYAGSLYLIGANRLTSHGWKYGQSMGTAPAITFQVRSDFDRRHAIVEGSEPAFNGSLKILVEGSRVEK